MLVKFKIFPDGRYMKFPDFSNTKDTEIWKHRVGENEYLSQTVNDIIITDYDSRFEMESVTKEEAQALLDSLSLGLIIDDTGNAVIDPDLVVKWKVDILGLKRKFTIMERTKIFQNEAYIDKLTTFIDGTPIEDSPVFGQFSSVEEAREEIKRILKQLISDLYDSDSGIFFNNDPMLREGLELFEYLGFLPSGRTLEVLELSK